MKFPGKNIFMVATMFILLNILFAPFSSGQVADSTKQRLNIGKLNLLSPVTGIYEIGYERSWKSGKWALQGNAGVPDKSQLWGWGDAQGFRLEGSLKKYFQNFHEQKFKIKSLLHGLYLGLNFRYYHLRGQRDFFDDFLNIQTTRFHKYNELYPALTIGCQVRFFQFLFLDLYCNPGYVFEVKNKFSAAFESVWYEPNYFYITTGLRLGVGF